MAKSLTQGKILLALASGERIMKTIVNEPPSQAGTFFKLTSGKTVRKSLLDRMLADGLIRECNDGLDLIGGSCQTYERATSL